LDLCSAAILLTTNGGEKAINSLQYTLELMQGPEINALIQSHHHDLIGRRVNSVLVDQTPIENRASALLNFERIGLPLFSRDEYIKSFQATKPEDVIAVIKRWATAPIFLNLRGHPDSLDALPTIDVIDAWRASPSSAARVIPSASRPDRAPG